MRQTKGQTRKRILDTAAELVRDDGPRALTFDAIAARLGVSKQAVLYWFPSKADLLADLAVPGLRAEAEAAMAAARSASGPEQAARLVVAAFVRFHLEDLDRFRLLYVMPGYGAHRAITAERQTERQMLAERIHPLTGRMYAEIATALGDGPTAREDAVALHMAALGHALLVAMTQAMDDPLRHDPAVLGARLASLLATGVPDTQGAIPPRSPSDPAL